MRVLKLHLFLTFFGLILTFSGKAENAKLDSLSLELERARSVEAKLNILYAISVNYNFINPDSAVLISSKGIELSEQNHQILLEAKFKSSLADAHRIKGNYQVAINLLLEAINIFDANNDELGMGDCYNKIGAVYIELNQFETAIDYFLKSLVKFEHQKNLKGISNCLNNLGASYFYLEEYEKAIDFFKRSLSVEEQNNSKQGVCEGLMNIGAVYHGLNNYELAEKYFIDAQIIAKEINDKSLESNLLNNISQIQLDIKDYHAAIENLKRAVALALESGNSDDLDTYLVNLSAAYARAGDYLSAYHTSQDLIVHRDSILSVENQRSIAEMTTKYKADQKEKENQILRQNAVISDLEIENQRWWMYGISSALFVMVVIGFLIFWAYRQKQKANVILKEQRDTIAMQKKDLTDSIQYARHLQDAILPEDDFLKGVFAESFIYYQPKDIVSGDFYWFHESEEYIFLSVADCTGHGVPGAMVSMVCHNAIQRTVTEFNIIETGKILDHVSELIEKTFSGNNHSVHDGMDISLLRITKKDLSIQWSGANNPLWILRKDAEEMDVIRPNPQPIGSFFERSLFTTNHDQLQRGDTCYLFSDGYVDQFGGPTGKKFKTGNLKKLFCALSKTTLQHQQEILINTHIQWKGEMEQVDDICVLGVRI
ncbi:MAG: tetratricopeptide repeat protein [Flavobacteriales bacterium]|nr:tetratricopeptide repeat protein [Flavobacteriales bacterium]